MAQQQFQIRQPISLSKRSLNMNHKIPYVDVISDAILMSPNRRLTAKEIFEHVSAKYGPMKKADTLKNTIRHTLSRYKVFRKVQKGRQKKPNWWMVDEEMVFGQAQARAQQPNEWRAVSTVSVGGQQQMRQQTHTPPTAVYPTNYAPASNQLLFHGTAQQMGPNFELKKTGDSCGAFRQVHPSHGAVACPPYQQPQPENPMNRNGHYVVSVEDFTTATFGPRATTFLPAPTMATPLIFK